MVLLIATWIFIQLPFVQNRLVQYAADNISGKLKTKVTVHGVGFTLFNKVNIEGLYVEDRQHDTLLAAGQLQINITDWFFLKDTVDLKYIGLKDAVVYLNRSTDSVWNYQFLSDYFGGKKDTSTTIIVSKATPKKVLSLHLRSIDLENIFIVQKDAWRGKTTSYGIGKINLEAEKLDYVNNVYDILSINLQKPVYTEIGYKGLWSYNDSLAYWTRIKALPPGGGFPKNLGNIQLRIAKLQVQDGFLEFKTANATQSITKGFNDRDIAIGSLSGTFDNVRWKQDTLFADADISAKERSGLKIKQLKTAFVFTPKMMEFNQLDFRLNESRLTNYYAMHFDSMDSFDDFENKVKLVGNLKNTFITTNDIGFFAADLLDKKQEVAINGYVSGYLNDLIAKDFTILTKGSNVSGDLRMTGLPNIDKTIIDLSTAGSTIQLDDVAVWAPALNRFDTHLKKVLGKVGFKGSFKGLVDDFSVKGDIQTIVGSVTTDLKMKLGKGRNQYVGIVGLHNFNAGKLLADSSLGILNFDGTVKGAGFGTETHLAYDGTIKNGVYNKYNYQHVHSQGHLDGTMLKSTLDLNDPNLQGSATVEVDLKNTQQRYVGKGNLTKANFKALHFSNQNLQFDGEFDVDFSGKKIDDFLGYAKLFNVHFRNGDIPLSFDSLIVNSSINESGKKELDFQTNELDASVQGQFTIADLPNSFQYFLNNYYPTLIPAPKKTIKDQDFSFALNTRNIEGYLQLFDKKINGLNNSNIIGLINTNDDQLLLNVSVPYFKYDNFQLSNASLIGTGNLNNLALSGKFDNMLVGDSLSFPNGSLNVSTTNGNSNVKIKTSSGSLLGDAEIVANIKEQKDGLKMIFDTSSFILNNKKWEISKGGEVFLQNNKQLNIDGITLKQEEQEVVISTQANNVRNNNDIVVKVKKLNVGELMPYITKDPRLEGIATGNFIITDPLKKPEINVDAQFEQFRLNGDSIGVLKTKGSVNLFTGIIDVNVVSPNKNYKFDGNVKANIFDSTGNQINTTLHFDHNRINLLKDYLISIFDDIDGYATGDLTIKGKFSSPQLIGNLLMTKGRIKVGYTKVTYFIDSGMVYLKPGSIDFGNLKLRDRFNNPGLLKGNFQHDFFRNMVFNLSVASSKMELINTTLKNNQLFYGYAIGSGVFELTGAQNNLKIRISAQPSTDLSSPSHISIANSNSRESGSSEDIVFKQYGHEMAAIKGDENDHMQIDVELKANNNATIDVILDPVSGDVITANGSGKIDIQMIDGVIKMDGKYLIEKGRYSYNFQSFIRKPFDLAGNGDNYIEWNHADPMDATLNIDAVYTAPSVSLSDLGGENSALLSKNVVNTKTDVYVIATIKGKLATPKISFKIDFPSGSPAKSDESINNLLNLMKDKSNQSELLRQVTYLVVFNQFAPYGGGVTNRNPGADLVVNTLSDIISKELGKILSKVVSQLTGDRSLQVDFNTSVYNSNNFYSGNINATNGYDHSTVNLKIQKNFANNKIIINVGTGLDLSLRNTSTTSSFQYLPDISLEFVLTNDRRLRFIVFKRDNLDIVGRRNRAGISFSYRQDFDPWFTKMQDSAINVTINHKKDEADSGVNVKSDK